MKLINDLRFALRSLSRAKGLSVTVILTLALGIGANASIFSVVRGVLLRPLVNRDEDRLVYIRQSTPGAGLDNLTFSVPEVNDFKSRCSDDSSTQATTARPPPARPSSPTASGRLRSRATRVCSARRSASAHARR